MEPTPAKKKTAVEPDMSLLLGAVTYCIMHALYFALIFFNLKLQFSSEASFSLLLVLLEVYIQHSAVRVSMAR